MRRISTLCIALLLIAVPLAGQETALVRRLAGQVEVQRPGTDTYAALEDSLRLPADARLRTGQTGIASIVYDDGTEITVRPRTVVRVGGEAGGGASVFLGRIRIKAERLLQAQGRSFRSPIAVAAIRGTELGIVVDESTVTEVYVFDGTVQVANVQLPGQAVLVQAGSMTRVAPFVPPTVPRPFQQEEFDRMGRLDALERGEDPVLEASQEPAAEAYLAYAVPSLDAVRNPAYAAGRAGVTSTTVLSAGGFRGHDGETLDGVTVAREDREGYDLFGRHVTLLPVGAGATAGVHAEAGTSLDDRTTTVPGASSSTDGRMGLVRGLVAVQRGEWGVGLGAGYRASSSSVDATAIGAGVTDTENGIVFLHAGLLRGVNRGRTLGMGFTHQALSSTVRVTDGGGSDVTGRDDAVRFLLRHQAGERRVAALLELRQTSTAETFTDLGAALYEEDRDVWSVRAGPGVGLMPASNLMVAGDLVGGFSYETASQVRPDGTIREDETDIRLSVSLHAAAQLLLGARWLVSVDVLDTVERTLKDFTMDPGPGQEMPRSLRITRHVARATTGIGYLGQHLLAEYVLTAEGDNRPFRHGIVVVWTP